MNPISLLKLKPQLKEFKKRHPKFFPFIGEVTKKADVDSVIEVSLKTSDGKTIVSNFKLTEEDVAMFADVRAALNK